MLKKILAFTAALCVIGCTAAFAAENDTEAAETAANEARTETISGIGSVSKVFCVTAAMQLHDRGLLDLDTPVTDYVPEFTMPDERYRDITVRMLMNHTSGLMGFLFGDNGLYGEASADYHDKFLDSLSRSRLKSAPGTVANYNNDGLTLLEIVVEHVSGESFTDYVQSHICAPLGLENTGTSLVMCGKDNTQVYIYGVRYATDYCMAFGSGGIMSTSGELCSFGKTFWSGDETLLSQASKDEMAKTSNTDKYEYDWGLGWDTVDFYGNCGIDTDAHVMFKGGALSHQFAGLMVEPDEEISVAVTMSGGDSTDVIMMSEALMSAALDEAGTKVGSDMPADVSTLESVPEKYLSMADIYSSVSGIYKVDFPEGKYMTVTELTSDNPKTVWYMYTESDSFVRMEGSPDSEHFIADSNREELSFTERYGNTYIRKYLNTDCDGFGRYIDYSYYLQRTGTFTVPETVRQTWQQRDGKKYYLSSLKYSNTHYNLVPFVRIKLPEGAEGFAKIQGLNKTVRFTDADKAEGGFVLIPGEAGRDPEDIEIFTENGTEYLRTQDKGVTLISEDAIPELTADIHEIPLETGRAKWYNIGEMGLKSVTLDIPEKAAVYVYDKFDKVVYSSYMKDFGNEVSLPESGKIVFVGESGAKAGIV